jgi:hypothetical protein
MRLADVDEKLLPELIIELLRQGMSV